MLVQFYRAADGNFCVAINPEDVAAVVASAQTAVVSIIRLRSGGRGFAVLGAYEDVMNALHTGTDLLNDPPTQPALEPEDGPRHDGDDFDGEPPTPTRQ